MSTSTAPAPGAAPGTPAPEASRRGTTLTDRAGRPIVDAETSPTAGVRGPMVMDDYAYLERVAHFDRERVPERVVHARGFVGHGTFTAYGTIGQEPASTYTRAALFARKDLQTPVSVRFSAVVGGKESAETLRDVRGFAVKFRTEAGNWDLVGNSIPVFFIRDPARFVDLIHAFKPDPVTYQQDFDRAFDFLSLEPSSNHMLTWLFSKRGLPADWFRMEGFGVNTFRLVNADGATLLVKFHWKSQQGVEGLTTKQAAAIQGEDLRHASGAAFKALEAGEFPRWELCVQLMSDEEHPELAFDPLDATKTWPEDQFPLLPVGMLEVDRNVTNFHAENEQIAFAAGALVDGIDVSEDRILQGRIFAYGDSQRHRIGPNYQQLPVNLPAATCPVATGLSEGAMALVVDGGDANPSVNYAPSSHGGLQQAQGTGPLPVRPVQAEAVVRQPLPRADDYSQAGERYRSLSAEDQDDLVLNLVTVVSTAQADVQERCVAMFRQCDAEYGQKIADGLAEAGGEGAVAAVKDGVASVVDKVKGSLS